MSKFEQAVEDTELVEIYSLMDQLKTIEVENPPDPNVTRALRIVDRILTDGNRKIRFLRQNVLVLYHGSLQYNDPHNLDLDLDFVTLDEDGASTARNGLVRMVETDFEDVIDWPEMGRNEARCGTDIITKSLEGIREEIKIVTQLLADGQDLEDYSYFPELWASGILTGHLFFEEQKQFQTELQFNIQELIQSSPVFKKLLLNQLRSVLHTRLERREERAKGSIHTTQSKRK